MGPRQLPRRVRVRRRRLRDVATRYVVESYDRDGRLLATHGGPYAPLVQTSYTIVRVRVFRNAHEMPPVDVHVAHDRIIGLRRR